MELARQFANKRAGIGFSALAALVLTPQFASEALAQDATAPSVVRPQHEAHLASQISGIIHAIPFDEGEYFRTGDTLIQLDCSIYESEAKAATAEASGALSILESRVALFERGAIGQLEIDTSSAQAAVASAKAETANLRVHACQIKAPFDGRIAEQIVNAFEYVQPGQPLLSVISDGKEDLEIIAPAEWLSWLRPGTIGKLRLEASRNEINVSVNTLGTTVDPVSRTVKLTAVIEKDDSNILPGMSGIVTFERPK